MLAPGQGMDQLTSASKASAAQFKSVNTEYQLMKYATGHLEDLLKFGQNLKHDQVLDSAAKIIGRGAKTTNIVRILSDMPLDDGMTLHGWVQSKAQQLAQSLQQVEQQKLQLQHQMGVDAMREIIGHTVQAGQGASPQQDSDATPGSDPLQAQAPSPGQDQAQPGNPALGALG